MQKSLVSTGSTQGYPLPRPPRPHLDLRPQWCSCRRRRLGRGACHVRAAHWATELTTFGARGLATFWFNSLDSTVSQAVWVSPSAFLFFAAHASLWKASLHNRLRFSIQVSRGGSPGALTWTWRPHVLALDRLTGRPCMARPPRPSATLGRHHPSAKQPSRTPHRYNRTGAPAVRRLPSLTATTQ